MAEKTCLGCDYQGEDVYFKLTTVDGQEEFYCPECMASVFENEPECVKTVVRLEA